MDTALDDDGNPVTIEMIRSLAVVPNLWCPGELLDGSSCGGKAWPTALESTKRSAAFAAHHGDGCDEYSRRSKDRPGDTGHQHGVGARAVRWRMRLGGTEPSSGPDGRRRPDDKRPGQATRRYHTERSRPDQDTADQRAFSTLLIDLVVDILPPDLELVIGTHKPVPAKQIVVHARDAAAAAWLGKDLIIWGKVAGYKRTRWEGLMLQLEHAADQVAILVDKHSLARLRITDADSLVGRHVIAYGHYTLPASGRAHVRAMPETVAFNPRVVRRRS